VSDFERVLFKISKKMPCILIYMFILTLLSFAYEIDTFLPTYIR